MKTCIGCKYADWNKTKSGRLHPSGEGQCRHDYQLPPLPNSRYWLQSGLVALGGYIERGKVYITDCPYYESEAK